MQGITLHKILCHLGIHKCKTETEVFNVCSRPVLYYQFTGEVYCEHCGQTVDRVSYLCYGGISSEARRKMKEKQKSGYAWIPSRFMYGGIARFYKRGHDYCDD